MLAASRRRERKTFRTRNDPLLRETECGTARRSASGLTWLAPSFGSRRLAHVGPGPGAARRSAPVASRYLGTPTADRARSSRLVRERVGTQMYMYDTSVIRSEDAPEHFHLSLRIYLLPGWKTHIALSSHRAASRSVDIVRVSSPSLPARCKSSIPRGHMAPSREYRPASRRKRRIHPHPNVGPPPPEPPAWLPATPGGGLATGARRRPRDAAAVGVDQSRPVRAARLRSDLAPRTTTRVQRA